VSNEAVVKTPKRTIVTFLGGPLSGRSQILSGELPPRLELEAHGTMPGHFFYLPGQPWTEWVLIDRPKPVVYLLEGLDCYRAQEA